MKKVKIQLIDGMMPTKGSEYAAAYDIYVPKDTPLTYGRQVIPAGFCMELPIRWSADIRPRSGFSCKGMEVLVKTKYTDGMTEPFIAEEKVRIDADVLLGLIDCDYFDEVGVIIVCRQPIVFAKRAEYSSYTVMGNEYVLTMGTRIAQMKIDSWGEDYELEEVKEIDKTIDRGGGFGHSGA